MLKIKRKEIIVKTMLGNGKSTFCCALSLECQNVASERMKVLLNFNWFQNHPNVKPSITAFVFQE